MNDYSHLLEKVKWVWLGDIFKHYKKFFLDRMKFPLVKYIDGKLEVFILNNDKVFLTNKIILKLPPLSHSSYFKILGIIHDSFHKSQLFATNLPKGWCLQSAFLHGDWREISNDEFEFILTVKTESEVFSKKIWVVLNRGRTEGVV